MGQLSATWTASDKTTATAAVPKRPPGAMSDDRRRLNWLEGEAAASDGLVGSGSIAPV
jgi:hypothetical protein